MATKLFLNVASPSLAQALCRAVDDNTPVAFPELVIGDGRAYELYLVDGIGGFDVRSGNASFIPYIAIGNCGFPTGGTQSFTFQSQTTPPLAWNVSPAALQTAMEALASIGAGNILVSGSAGKYYTFTFIGALGGTDQAEIIGNFDSLTPPSTIDISTIVEGGSGVNEIQLASLSVNPLTFADDWTPITNGWTGQLSTRTVEVFAAFAAAGGTLNELFQVTIADPSGVRTTLVKTPASIQCTIIDPESFAGADKPLLATQAALNAAVLGLNNFTREALTSAGAGNTNVTRPSTSRHHTARIAINGSASTRTISVMTNNSPVSGDTEFVILTPDANAGNVVEFHNATAGGTLLATITTDATSRPYFLVFTWSGSIWQLDFNEARVLVAAGNLSGLGSTLLSKANLKSLFSRISTQSVSFTVLPVDEGTLFRVATAAGAVLATLPTPAAAGIGALIALQKTDGSSNALTTSPATESLAVAGMLMVIQSDGSSWNVVWIYDPSAGGGGGGGGIGIEIGTTTNNAGNSTISPAQAIHTDIITVTGSARTSLINIDSGGGPADGWLCKMRVVMPSTAAIIIEFHDADSGDLIYTLNTDDQGGAAMNYYLELVWFSGAWNPLLNVSPVV